MITGFIGTKIGQTQGFTQTGVRIPISKVSVVSLPIVSIKTKEKDGYTALQVSVGAKKREIPIKEDSVTMPNVGDILKITEVVKPGDIVDVTGISKGKGFAGVVKRHHFKGGPRTHGQSDRERAPGSIGQTTTPGRVYKGKRMAGRMGHNKVTVKNLTVMDATDNEIVIKGLIPGIINGIVMIKKVGESKKFSPLYKVQIEEIKEGIKDAS
ncbi:MAG: 50S ribosomal protein L3 [Candidatus Levybacteria bacterium]|nr:50S ribosomal protein L3 [Candidatus Levybacteria bacterium]